MTKLSIGSSGIEKICNVHVDKCQINSLEALLTGYSLTFLNLSGNEFQPSKTFKQSMTHMGKTQILLRGNNTECDCSALWLSDWLNKSRTINGERLVKDYMDVTCSTGKPGLPVYKLKTDVEYLAGIGCFPPSPVPIWILQATGALGGLIILIIICILIIQKNQKRLRWLVYKYFGKFIGERMKNEDLEKIEYDAFLSYR